jgi:cytochrome P450
VASIPEDIGLSGVPLPPLNIDPPLQRKFRRMLLPFFSPARADAMRSVTRDIANRLIDSFADRGSCDVATEYAGPLPTAVLARILGVPESDDAKFAGWIHAIVEGGAGGGEQAQGAGLELLQYFTMLSDERRSSPGDDIISFLLDARMDGGPLSDADRLGCCILLLIAGIDTTWSTLGSSLLYLAQHPDERPVFLSDSTDSRRAIEELLRAFAPTSVARGVRGDDPVEVSGTRMSPGDKVLVQFPSANRDEGVFERPDDVLLDREPNRHVAFGHGVHVCLGAPIARMELQIGIQEFLRRVPSFSLIENAEITWKAGPIRGPNRVPVAFSAPASGAPGHRT